MDRPCQGLWMYNVSRKKADLSPFSGYDEPAESKYSVDIRLDLYYICTSNVHQTLLNAPALIPNHLRFITKLLGRAVRNRLFSFRQSLIKAAGAIWVEFPVMMCFQGAPFITAYPRAQTLPLFEPSQAAQTWWKSLPDLNCLVAQLPAIHTEFRQQTFVLLNEKTTRCIRPFFVGVGRRSFSAWK